MNRNRMSYYALALPLLLLTHGVSHAQGHDEHAHHQQEQGAAADHSAHAAHVYAPIGVMGDHAHPKGEVMASYRYMRMKMDTNYDGTEKLSPGEVISDYGYMVSPTEMTMDMHMFGLMYAPIERLTLGLMLPVIVKEMDHRNMMGVEFSTRSTGIGDIGLMALVTLFSDDANQVLLNAGITFPSGNINEMDTLPTSGGNDVLLPYPMQTGSGTVDLKPGFTWTGQRAQFNWGAQATGTFRLGENKEDYRLGHAYDVTAWAGWTVVDALNVSMRLDWQQWFDISGRDSRLDMMVPVVPTADTDLRAGRRLDLGPGLSVQVPGQAFDGLRLAFEMLFPVYQNLDGPQLGSQWTLVVGTQYVF